MEKSMISWFMMTMIILGSVAPFATAASAAYANSGADGFTGSNYASYTKNYQSSRPSFGDANSGTLDNYWPILNNLKEDQCDAENSDFIIGIPPGGCEPMVVRSDLLAEQNVPVMCQLSAIRVNPFIDVSTIKSISFKGDYPKEVAGISFHPARAAVKSYRTLLGDPFEENIGYVVIVLKDQPDERNLTDEISGMLTATVRYDAQGSFGTGAGEYYLEVQNNEDWQKDAAKSSFWAGNGYLRVKSVQEDSATIEVMSEKDNVYRTVTLKEGETSGNIYTPGQYCTASMKLKLNKIDNSEDMARLNIDGDTFWVRKNSKLLGGKCTIQDLNVFPGGSGTIDISCLGNSKFTLILGNKGVVLNNGSAENINVGIGGHIKGEGGKDIYLGYYGKNSFGTFAILFDKVLLEDDVSLITGIFDVEDFSVETDMYKALDRFPKFKNNFKIVGLGGQREYGISVVSVEAASAGAGYPEATQIPKYLGLADEAVSELVDKFPSEKYPQATVSIGEKALREEIDLAGRAKDLGLQLELIRKFLSTYPGSPDVENIRDKKLNLENFDHTASSYSVFVNNNNYNIRAEGFQSGSGQSDSVDIVFGSGATHTLKRGMTYEPKDLETPITDKTKINSLVQHLTVVDIDGRSAELTYVWEDTNDKNKKTYSTETIQVGDSANLGGVGVRVVRTSVREVAYVSLIPNVRNTETKANFTFNIGVEERAFELSPEEARRKIDNLNKTIAEWEDKIEKLGDLVRGMKAACLATSTVLTLKSFISGFSGATALARKEVMEKYEAKCRLQGYTKENMFECFSIYNKNGDIERDVAAHGNVITGVNTAVQDCTKGTTSVKSSLFKAQVVDDPQYVKDLEKCVKEDWSYTINGETVKRADLVAAKDYQAVLTYEGSCNNPEDQATIAQINNKQENTDVAALTTSLTISCQIAKGKMDSALADNLDRARDLRISTASSNELKSVVGEGGKAPTVTSGGDKNTVVDSWGKDFLSDFPNWEREVKRLRGATGTSDSALAVGSSADRLLADRDYTPPITDDALKDTTLTLSLPILTGAATAIGNNIVEKQKVQVHNYKGVNYLLILSDGGLQGRMYASESYKIDGASLSKTDPETSTALRNFVFIGKDKDDTCSNLMRQPYVQYYESANQKGFARIVPVDDKKGWYAYVKNDAYNPSGVVNSFYLCNVGVDGLIGGGPSSTDICQEFRTAEPNREFISCGRFDATKLFKDAEQQIYLANRNKNGVDLNGKFIRDVEPIGPESTAVECTDFMTFDECSLMFNVCDPVICPPSRCNLGGKFPVSDVVASGIIGSIALCLPNFGSPSDGKVLIPVCLSGIHAGLDAYVAILKQHMSCLEEQVETGRYTGICDEMTAVYTCQFFWGQFAPIMDTLLVRFVEGITGGAQARGGAEYLTVQTAFDNLEKSIDYFSSNYMANSFRAFNLKNVEEVGDTVCKGFVGTSFPTSGDALDSFLDPESPVQFSAYFTENDFSKATVPATSHYKVFYQIYSGNDRGTQYRVYLKDPPSTGYYSNRPTLLVDSGYAEKGTSASESVDFTAPSGYKTLCVSINGNDECGFKQVSSSFAVNYATQAYVADQVNNKEIVTSQDCTTTSVSAWGLAKPNIQSGVEDALGGDDLATTGITRVCASVNPEKGVVGGNDVYCDPNEGIGKEQDNTRCDFGYYCAQTEGSEFGICKNKGNEINQASQGNWIDVGYCDNERVRCWLDARTVGENLDLYMAVHNTTVSELTKTAQEWNETIEQYKNVAAKLDGLRQDIDALGKANIEDLIIKESSESFLTSKVQLIIQKLDEVSGVEDNIGAGTNADKAEALAMKGTVYALIVDTLLKDVANVDATFIGGRPPQTTPEPTTSQPTTGTSGGDFPSSSGGVSFVQDTDGCKKIVGQRIIEIAKQEKNDIKDSDIERDTGIKSFECLALHIAMQESHLTHCSSTSAGKCTDCSGEIVKGDADASFGVMQINTAFHKVTNLDNFETNVRYGVNLLKSGYRSETSHYDCANKDYIGWEQAVRRYNGWNTDCSKGITNYVEEVLGRQPRSNGVSTHKEVISLFPECAFEGEVVSGGSVTALENTQNNIYQYEPETPEVKLGDIKEGFILEKNSIRYEVYKKVINDDVVTLSLTSRSGSVILKGDSSEVLSGDYSLISN